MIVALNIDDTPLRLTLADLGVDRGEVLGGSGAPPTETVRTAEVAPHGWLIIAAR